MKIRTTLITSLLVACGSAPAAYQRTTPVKSENSSKSPASSSTDKPTGSSIPSTSGTIGDSNQQTPKTTEPAPIPTPKPTTDVPVVAGKVSDLKVLVFSKTLGFRHGDAIEAGLKQMTALAAKHKFTVTATEDSALFTKENLAKYNVVFFLDTTGEVLDEAQKKAFQEYMVGGGGWLGTHSATDTHHNWEWYKTSLTGAEFNGHSGEDPATVKVENIKHPTTAFLGAVFPDGIWKRPEEWYNFKVNPRPNVTVLLTVDETTYGNHGDRATDHPITWCHDVEKGRAWYTGFGHQKLTFNDPVIMRMIMNGLLWSAKIDTTVTE